MLFFTRLTYKNAAKAENNIFVEVFLCVHIEIRKKKENAEGRLECHA